MRKYKNIALCISMLENEFSSNICKGALLGAKDADANLFVLPGGFIDADYNDAEANTYRYQYNSLYSLVSEKGLDAVIIDYGTITSFLDEERKTEFLNMFGSLPVILLAGMHKCCSSLCFDNRIALKQLICRVLKEGKGKHPAFLSGPATNQDAKERLDVFLEAMEEFGFHGMEDHVAYGNFSEYVEEQVEDLFQRHPQTDIVFCANDRMAMAVYAVAGRLGRQVGKDLFVTGFDDSPTATLLNPGLTSIKADPMELAYHAVMEAVRLKPGAEFHKTLATRMVIRESCGLNAKSIDQVFKLQGIPTQEELYQTADAIFDRFSICSFKNKDNMRLRGRLRDYFKYCFGMLDKEGRLRMHPGEYQKQFFRFCEIYDKGYISMEQLLVVDTMIYDCISFRLRDGREKERLLKERLLVSLEFQQHIRRRELENEHQKTIFAISLANVMRDMLQYMHSEKKKFATLIQKLKDMKFDSAYVFTYPEGVMNEMGMGWKQPGEIYLRASLEYDKIHVYSRKEKKVKTDVLFRNRYLPQNRRVCMFVVPLFCEEKQLGIIMTESPYEYYIYAAQMACQISISLGILETISRQNMIKKELECVLQKVKESNKVLDEMSHSDPLTGICNRRGFLEAVRKLLLNKANEGVHAVAIYADMDNLKIVNDEFGHEDGDFALRTIAEALRESFRKSDVVARMGGDEFAAFAVMDGENLPQRLRKRIQSILARLNVNDKPYYVNISIGIHEFEIHDGCDIEDILSRADADLYREKHSKTKVIYKPEFLAERK